VAYVPAGSAAVGEASVRLKPTPPIDHRAGALPFWARGRALVEQPDIVKLAYSSSRKPEELGEIRWFEPGP